MKENIVTSRTGDIVQVSFSKQKCRVNEITIRRILRSGQFTGEIAGYNMQYFKNGVILIVINPTAWKGPDTIIKKIEKAIADEK